MENDNDKTGYAMHTYDILASRLDRHRQTLEREGYSIFGEIYHGDKDSLNLVVSGLEYMIETEKGKRLHLKVVGIIGKDGKPSNRSDVYTKLVNRE